MFMEEINIKSIKLFVSGLLLLICFFIVNTVYPYSFFSFGKVITYNADNSIVQDYNKVLSNLKMHFETNNNKDLNKTEYILDMFKQKWLVSENEVKIRYHDLDKMLNEVKKSRDILIEYALLGNYSEIEKDFLKKSIEQCFFVEENIYQLKNSKHYTRAAIKRQLHNLHINFANILDSYSTFFYEYVK